MNQQYPTAHKISQVSNLSLHKGSSHQEARKAFQANRDMVLAPSEAKGPSAAEASAGHPDCAAGLVPDPAAAHEEAARGLPEHRAAPAEGWRLHRAGPPRAQKLRTGVCTRHPLGCVTTVLAPDRPAP